MDYKDFYVKLNSILNDYRNCEIDKEDAIIRVDELASEAESNGLTVNLDTDIIDDIEQDSSYEEDTSSY